MKRALCLLWILPALGRAEVTLELQNAATVYQAAFSNQAALSPADQEAIKAGTFPAAGQAAIDLFREGAAIPDVDWALPFEEDGFATAMPHLRSARYLSRLAQAHASSVLSSHPDEFMKDQVAAQALARHVGRDGGVF
ncbi:MAG: hypothetical protein AAF492_20705 [Verrucomicrobiota bacterium]